MCLITLLILSPTVFASNYSIIVSDNSKRSNSVLLEASNLTGLVYIQVMNDPSIDQVKFYLDSNSGPAYRIERIAPYDMEGSYGRRRAKAFNTNKLPDGSHYINASIVLKDGSVITETAYFIIDNALSSIDNVSTDSQNSDPNFSQSSLNVTSSSFTFVVNVKSKRSDRYPLQSSILSGNTYIELLSDIQIKQVAFYLDSSPSSARPARHIERKAPYDFSGNNFFNVSGPFNTNSVPDGAHTIFALITLDDDTKVTAKTDFYIRNTSSDALTKDAPSYSDQNVIDTSSNSSTNDDFSYAGRTLINWSAPTKRENGFELLQSEIVQYVIYFGTQSKVYTDSITITEKSNNVLPTSVFVDNLEPGIVYYFSGITVDSNGLRSALSNEVSRLITLLDSNLNETQGHN